MTNIDVATTSSEAEMNQQLVVAKRRLDFAGELWVFYDVDIYILYILE